jgi:hypothetical protein
VTFIVDLRLWTVLSVDNQRITYEDDTHEVGRKFRLAWRNNSGLPFSLTFSFLFVYLFILKNALRNSHYVLLGVVTIRDQGIEIDVTQDWCDLCDACVHIEKTNGIRSYRVQTQIWFSSSFWNLCGRPDEKLCKYFSLALYWVRIPVALLLSMRKEKRFVFYRPRGFSSVQWWSHPASKRTIWPSRIPPVSFRRQLRHSSQDSDHYKFRLQGSKFRVRELII